MGRYDYLMTTTATRAMLGHAWGTAIGDHRRLLRMSQRRLAQLCGVTQQTLSKIERGSVIPADPLKVAIAAHLGVAPGELFAWPDEVLAEVAS